MNKTIFIALCLSIILIFSGCTQPQPEKATIVSDNNPLTVVGNDADVHGCIGSAGYQWCEEKQKCIRTWEETCTVQGNGDQTQVLPDNCTGVLTTKDINNICTTANEKFDPESIKLYNPTNNIDNGMFEFMSAKSWCSTEIQGEFYVDKITLDIFEINNSTDAQTVIQREFNVHQTDIQTHGATWTTNIANYERTLTKLNVSDSAFIFINNASNSDGTTSRSISIEAIKGNKLILIDNFEANERNLCTKDQLIDITKLVLSRIN